MIITPVTENGSNIISHFIAIKQDISSRKEMEKIFSKVKVVLEVYLKMQRLDFTEQAKAEMF